MTELRFTIVLNPPNPTYIANEVLDFPIENPNRFIYFRLYCTEAEPTNPGLVICNYMYILSNGINEDKHCIKSI